MHSTGSVILTMLERLRNLLDEPTVEAKYDQDYMVRHLIGPSLVDAISRLSNTISCPVINKLTINLDLDQDYYKLPPCVQEVLRLVIVDNDDSVVADLYPRDRMDWRGQGWRLEGGPGALSLWIENRPTSLQSLELWYSSNGDCLPHYSTDGGSASSYQISVTGATWTEATKTITKTNAFSSYTFVEGDKITITGGTGATAGVYEIDSKTDASNIVLKTSIGSSADGQTDIAGRTWVRYVDLDSALSTSGDIGGMDRRDSAYVGQVFRFLPATEVFQDEVISSYGYYANSKWRVGLRFPIDAGATPAAMRYEIVPMGSNSLIEMVSAICALKLGVGLKISQTHRDSILLVLRYAQKTIGDNLTNMQAVRPPHWSKSTSANETARAWSWTWPG